MQSDVAPRTMRSRLVAPGHRAHVNQRGEIRQPRIGGVVHPVPKSRVIPPRRAAQVVVAEFRVIEQRFHAQGIGVLGRGVRPLGNARIKLVVDRRHLGPVANQQVVVIGIYRRAGGRMIAVPAQAGGFQHAVGNAHGHALAQGHRGPLVGPDDATVHGESALSGDNRIRLSLSNQNPFQMIVLGFIHEQPRLRRPPDIHIRHPAVARVFLQGNAGFESIQMESRQIHVRRVVEQKRGILHPLGRYQPGSAVQFVGAAGEFHRYAVAAPNQQGDVDEILQLIGSRIHLDLVARSQFKPVQHRLDRIQRAVGHIAQIARIADVSGINIPGPVVIVHVIGQRTGAMGERTGFVIDAGVGVQNHLPPGLRRGVGQTDPIKSGTDGMPAVQQHPALAVVRRIPEADRIAGTDPTEQPVQALLLQRDAAVPQGNCQQFRRLYLAQGGLRSPPIGSQVQPASVGRRLAGRPSGIGIPRVDGPGGQGRSRPAPIVPVALPALQMELSGGRIRKQGILHQTVNVPSCLLPCAQVEIRHLVLGIGSDRPAGFVPIQIVIPENGSVAALPNHRHRVGRHQDAVGYHQRGHGVLHGAQPIAPQGDVAQRLRAFGAPGLDPVLAIPPNQAVAHLHAAASANLDPIGLIPEKFPVLDAKGIHTLDRQTVPCPGYPDVL